MKMENFIHKNRAEIRKDFPAFRIVESYKRWMHGPAFTCVIAAVGQTDGLTSFFVST
jgi:hypothetical protein